MGIDHYLQDLAMDLIANNLHKMGSTADHQYEESRVPPKQWEKVPNNPLEIRCGPPKQDIGTAISDAMINELKRQLDPIKPNYYRRTIKGVEIDVIDIIQAFGLGFLAGNALKYLLRAGRKDDRKQDLNKCIECLSRLKDEE